MSQGRGPLHNIEVVVNTFYFQHVGYFACLIPVSTAHGEQGDWAGKLYVKISWMEETHGIPTLLYQAISKQLIIYVLDLKAKCKKLHWLTANLSHYPLNAFTSSLLCRYNYCYTVQHTITKLWVNIVWFGWHYWLGRHFTFLLTVYLISLDSLVSLRNSVF